MKNIPTKIIHAMTAQKQTFAMVGKQVFVVLCVNILVVVIVMIATLWIFRKAVRDDMPDTAIAL